MTTPPPTKQGFTQVYGSKRRKYHYYDGNRIICGRHKQFIPMMLAIEKLDDRNNCKHCLRAITKTTDHTDEKK